VAGGSSADAPGTSGEVGLKGPSELVHRVGVAAVGVPLVLAGLVLGGWVLGVMVAGVAAITAHEFYGLARAGGATPFAALGVMASAGAVLLATAFPGSGEAWIPLGVLLTVLALATLGASVWLRWPDGAPLASASATVLGVLYCGVPLAFVPILRDLPETVPGALTGNPWQATAFVLLPLLTTWIGDTAAYFAGRRWGRRRIAPHASPNKTVLGSVAGLAGSVAAAVGVSLWALSGFPFLTVDPWTAAWIGLLLGVAAQVGDLAESVLKREAGVKDSGSLLPGHGGFLDRMDALLFALPSAWLLLVAAGIL